MGYHNGAVLLGGVPKSIYMYICMCVCGGGGALKNLFATAIVSIPVLVGRPQLGKGVGCCIQITILTLFTAIQLTKDG